MRPIKFRAWNEDYKIMLPPFHLKIYISSNESAQEEMCPLSKYPIMQFTWLLDKNGKEIYEWDIAIIFWIPAELRYSDTWCGWVFFDKNRPIELQELPFYDGEKWNYKDCEIIWNIYQHPELLK